LEGIGHPDWESKGWLAITGMEVFKQNGRETLYLVAIRNIEDLGRKNETRMGC
jgi:hypothetical protein